MPWIRISIALGLAIAVAGIPLALGQCDTTCAQSRAAAVVAEAHAADPTCRPANTRVATIEGLPTSCGHNHTGIDRASVGETPQVRAVAVSLVGAAEASLVMTPARTIQARVHHSTSPPGAYSHALAVSLRI